MRLSLSRSFSVPSRNCSHPPLGGLSRRARIVKAEPVARLECLLVIRGYRSLEIWGEVGGNTTAKNAAMDALTASLIGPGLIGTSLKYAVGRVRPNTATRTFELKPFSNNQSFSPAMPPKHLLSRRPSQKTTRFGGSRSSATTE
jgi:hypothetical protein